VRKIKTKQKKKRFALVGTSRLLEISNIYFTNALDSSRFVLTGVPVYISLALNYFPNKRTQYFETTLNSQLGEFSSKIPVEERCTKKN